MANMTGRARHDELPISAEQVYQGMKVLEKCIDLDGPIHWPLYEKFEAKYIELCTLEAEAATAAKAAEVR